MIGKGKKAAIVLSIVMMIAVLFLAGCNKEEESASAGGETTEKEVEKAKPVDLVMGHPFSAQHPVSKNILQPLADALAEQSDGRIKMTIHAGGSVTSPATIYEDVVSGAIDIGWTLQGYTPGKYPVTESVEQPFIFDTTKQASATMWAMLHQNESMKNEYKEVKVLGLWMTDPGEFLSKESIKEPGDLAGMRIRFSGAPQEVMINHLGGTPVGLAMPEVYDSLERGIIDAVAVGPSVIASYKLNEVIGYATKGLRTFFASQVIFMNKDKWESMSPEDQELLDSLTGVEIYEKGTDIYMGAYEHGYNLGKESGVVINEISDAEREVWKKATGPVIEEYIEKMDKNGYPGQEIMDKVYELAEEFAE